MILTASKIPPISENSTASNISFETKGKRIAPEKCTGQENLLPASHGVISRPATAIMKNPMDLIPLLSPTTEKNLMMENWLLKSPNKTLIYDKKNRTDDTTIWKENYQDLSDWCMDPFIQGPCDSPMDKFDPLEILGMKYDDNSVITKQGGCEIDQGGIYAKYEGEKVSGIMAETQLINNQQTQKHKAETVEGITILPDGWLNPQKSSIALRTDEWIKQIDDEAMGENIKRENWDVISNESNEFDLLSYLCNDDVLLREESVSTDATSISSPNTSRLSENSLTIDNNIMKKEETITSSTVPSHMFTTNDLTPLFSSTKKTSLRSTRLIKTNYIPNEKERTKIKNITKPSKGKKRKIIESDSEDETMSDCSSNYRDSREKNNEASRKSRMNKKAKENEMMAKATKLEKNNRLLKIKVDELEKIVTTMRAAILRCALQKNI